MSSELIATLDGVEPAATDRNAYVDAVRAREAALVALAPVFHEPSVFDAVLAIVERPAGRSVQEPLWSKLFSPYAPETYVVPRLDGAQAARCAKALIAVSLSHPQIHARNAAGQALHRFSPRSAEGFLIAALAIYAEKLSAMEGAGAELDHAKTEREQLEAVTSNLYDAVVGLATPAARAAIIERLFAERRAYWSLAKALAHGWTGTVHLDVLAALEKRRDGRAAALYAYALEGHVKSAPALVELGRMIATWEAEGEHAGWLHYATITCQVAALGAHDYPLVRLLEELKDRMRADPTSPDARWRDPYGGDQAAEALARVMSGRAEREHAALLEEGRAARDAGRPRFAITDIELGMLAGTTVAERLHVERTSGTIWFRDVADRVFVFDGYDIVEPPFETTGVQLVGADHVDERVMWWTRPRTRYREAIRIGDAIVLTWGANGGAPARQIFKFRDTAEAWAAMMALRANVPDDLVSTDPYYLPGTGAIVRTYYVHGEREAIWVRDGEPASIAEHARRELAWIIEHGATLASIEYAAAYRRREDLTVREWIGEVFRSGGLGALGEVAQYLDAHGLRAALPELDLQLGAPASEADVDMLAGERAQPVPDALRAMWRVHGRASWKLGTVGRRLLGPREVLARRAATGADVIVESLDGQVIAKVDDGWEAAVAGLLGDLERALADVAPVLDRLAYGMRAERHERAVQLVREGATWEAIVDLDSGVAVVREGSAPSTIERVDPAVAEAWLDRVAAEKWAEGWRNPEDAAAEAAKVVKKRQPVAAKKQPAARKPAAKKPAVKKPAAKRAKPTPATKAASKPKR